MSQCAYSFWYILNIEEKCLTIGVLIIEVDLILEVSCGRGSNVIHAFPVDNGKELLSLNEVLNYLLRSSSPLLEESKLAESGKIALPDWQSFVDRIRGMIVTYPGMVRYV